MKPQKQLDLTAQQRHALQVFRAVMRDLPLSDREYTRPAGEKIDGFFFSILSLSPITLEPYDAYWESTLAFGTTRGERNAISSWPMTVHEIAGTELKNSLLGVGRPETDCLTKNEWTIQLRRDITDNERLMIAKPPDEQRYRFYFSRRQQIERERDKTNGKVVRLQRSPQALAQLDNGKVVEFTERIFLEPYIEQWYKNTRPHEERYSDSVVIGEGVIVTVEPFQNEVEKGIRLVRQLDVVR